MIEIVFDLNQVITKIQGNIKENKTEKNKEKKNKNKNKSKKKKVLTENKQIEDKLKENLNEEKQIEDKVNLISIKKIFIRRYECYKTKIIAM